MTIPRPELPPQVPTPPVKPPATDVPKPVPNPPPTDIPPPLEDPPVAKR